VAQEFSRLTSEADRLRADFRLLADRDARAYDGVMQAYRLPKDTDDERRRRQECIDRALLHAATVPLDTARAAAALLPLARRAAEAGNRNSVCDAGVAALLAEGALRGAVYNVEVNVRSLSSPERGADLSREARELDRRGADEAAAAARAVAAGLGRP
jgi:formiminotetrahydrofolate cyclodeaminase